MHAIRQAKPGDSSWLSGVRDAEEKMFQAGMDRVRVFFRVWSCTGPETLASSKKEAGIAESGINLNVQD